MKFEVLLSCMHQSDFRIVYNSNIQSDLLMVNQADKICLLETKLKDIYKIRMISTTERGLSRSRNMAMLNSAADICLFADDDELFVDNYQTLILEAFRRYADADVITFSLQHPGKKFPTKACKAGYLDVLQMCSCQIAFRLKAIAGMGISFDVFMGSGSGNGGGEDTRFLFDCLRKKLNIYYVPITIASVKQNDSKWFSGFTAEYFLHRGWANRRIMGPIFALLYAFQFCVAKYRRYKDEQTFLNALRLQIRGIVDKKPAK